MSSTSHVAVVVLLTQGTCGRHARIQHAQAIATVQTPRAIFAAVLASVETSPASRRPQRRAVGETDCPEVADALIEAGRTIVP